MSKKTSNPYSEVNLTIRLICRMYDLDYEEVSKRVSDAFSNIDIDTFLEKAVPNIKKNIKTAANSKKSTKEVEEPKKPQTKKGKKEEPKEETKKATIKKKGKKEEPKEKKGKSEPKEKEFVKKDFLEKALKEIEKVSKLERTQGKTIFYNVDSGRCVTRTDKTKDNYNFYEKLSKYNTKLDKKLNLAGKKTKDSKLQEILEHLDIKIKPEQSNVLDKDDEEDDDEEQQEEEEEEEEEEDD